MTYPKTVLSLIIGPVRVELAPNGQTILTHLQKFSRCGVMLTWPFCFHVWFFWEKQMYTIYDQTGAITWLPGTEQGIYMRTPGWRWDAEFGMILTKGYLGLRWD